ncbi:MAG: response regulator [Candidatus Peribacteraceae bacterium]|nr:response regulator [Candidatus Peribacteraceae bacterium]
MKKNIRHILVAEDDAFLLGMIRRVLSKHEVRVSTARNGQEAIDVILKDPPDLLLLDLLMPIVDGYAVLELRKKKKLTFPVVVCSNLSDKKNIVKCDGLGVNEYVIKSDMDDDQIWTVAEKYL